MEGAARVSRPYRSQSTRTRPVPTRDRLDADGNASARSIVREHSRRGKQDMSRSANASPDHEDESEQQDWLVSAVMASIEDIERAGERVRLPSSDDEEEQGDPVVIPGQPSGSGSESDVSLDADGVAAAAAIDADAEEGKADPRLSARLHTARSVHSMGSGSSRPFTGKSARSTASQRESSRLLKQAFANGVQTATYNRYDDMFEGFRAGNQIVFQNTIKMAIVVTIFNEQEEELRRTMEGLAYNMESLNLTNEEIIVAIVADGRVNLSASAKAWGEGLGIIDPDALDRAGEDVMAGRAQTALHVFENPTVAILPNTPIEQSIPIMFAIKEKNAGKLSSHRWFFDGLCKAIKPEVIMLIDAGTQPKPGALEGLRLAFEEHPHLGGCCGELKVYQPLCFDLVNAAQQFEYKMSHIMDKAMESVFGFVTVLPGAFSAYRYAAVIGAPLDKYFHCEHNAVTSPFMSNMYLAEDRILGFEVLVRDGGKWTLSYVSDSVADTDVPDTVVGLVRQRRRWLNGAFFTMLYFLQNWWRVFVKTDHSLLRKFAFFIQFLYMIATLVLTWTTIGNMYLSFYIVMSITVPDHQWFNFLQVLYAGLICVQFVYALGTKATDFPRVYVLFSILHGIIMLCTVVSLFNFLIAHSSLDFIFLLGTVGIVSYALVTIVYGEVCFVLSSAVQYVIMVPTFMSVIMVFSFCNIHDVSWGTREAQAISGANVDKKAMEEMYKKAEAQATRMRRARCMLVAAWVLTNWIFVSVFVQLGITQSYALGVVYAYGAMLGLRVVLSCVYRVQTLVWGCIRRIRRHVKRPQPTPYDVDV